jgi:hypothetical protein
MLLLCATLLLVGFAFGGGKYIFDIFWGCLASLAKSLLFFFPTGDPFARMDRLERDLDEEESKLEATKNLLASTKVKCHDRLIEGLSFFFPLHNLKS